MNQVKCNSIEDYLKEEFPNSSIEQAEISENQLYRIQTDKGLFMLKIGGEFIEDNPKEEIIEKLKYWEVPGLLRENSKLGVMVTASGPSTYQRH